jgi:hypothetical protein
MHAITRINELWGYLWLYQLRATASTSSFVTPCLSFFRGCLHRLAPSPPPPCASSHCLFSSHYFSPFNPRTPFPAPSLYVYTYLFTCGYPFLYRNFSFSMDYSIKESKRSGYKYLLAFQSFSPIDELAV